MPLRSRGTVVRRLEPCVGGLSAVAVLEKVPVVFAVVFHEGEVRSTRDG